MKIKPFLLTLVIALSLVGCGPKPDNSGNGGGGDESGEVTDLTQLKNNAKSELTNYKNPNLYRDAEKTQLSQYVEQGKAAIDAALNEADINSALASAKTNIDSLKTKAQYEEEEAAVALNQAKTAAKSELEGYKNASDYRESEATQLATIVSNGKTAIDAATDTAGVASALAAAKAQADALKTKAQYEAEEAALAEAKTNAKAELAAYKNSSDYRPEEQALLAQYISEGNAAIDAATNEAGVASALATAKAKIDGLKTAAEYDAEEAAAALAKAKSDAIEELEGYVNPNDYRDTEKTRIASILSESTTAINACNTIEDVNAALAEAKSKLDSLFTDAELTEMYIEMAFTFDLVHLADWMKDGATFKATLDMPDGNTVTVGLTKVAFTRFSANVPQGASKIQFFRYDQNGETVWGNTDKFNFNKNVPNTMFDLDDNGNQVLLPFAEPGRLFLDISAVKQGDPSWEEFAIAYHANGQEPSTDRFVTFFADTKGQAAIEYIDGYDQFKLLRIPTLSAGTELTWELFNDGVHDWGHMDSYKTIDIVKPYFVLTSGFNGSFYSFDDKFSVSVTNDTPSLGDIQCSLNDLNDLVPGTVVSFMVTPNDNYELDYLTINGVNVTPTDDVYTFRLAEDTVVHVGFKEKREKVYLDVDLGVAGDIISGEGWDDVVAKFFNGDKSRQQYVLPVYNGFMARFEVPDWAVTVNFIRIPGKTSGEGQPDVITDEWVNSHFWGGNASNTLVPGVQTAKLNKTTYLLENLPTNIVLDINVSGFITGGERVGFYFYNKANSDNIWVQGTIESSTVTVVVPQGYTHFQVLRTELSDSPLSWSCPNWGQINEVALIPESNELLVTGELVSMNASWVYADRYITLDFTGSDIIHDGWGDGVVIYMIGGDRDDFAELTMESLYVAKIKVIPNTTSIKIIRIPLADKPNPVTWEWINDSHFWGGNVEISLPADAVSGTVGSDYTVTWD